ncbi:MAG: DUF5666 domain-containing protein [Pseudomonadota bacterium]
MNLLHTKVLATAAFVSLLSACSGGGGDAAPTLPPPAGSPGQGIDRTGLIAFGAVTGFGSVIVNGTRFDTSATEIVYDGVPVTESDLQVGHIALVVGDEDDDGNASATRIESDDTVRGPITAIDLANDTFVVLGQTVVVRVDTAFDDDIAGNNIGGLTIGQDIAVSGYLLPDGSVRATRVEPDDGDDLQVVGFITSADDAAMTFEIGMLTVDYAGATLEDFDGQTPAAGDLVEVEGQAVTANGVLVADEVDREDDSFQGNDGDDIELYGVITQVVSATEFEVNGFPITTDANTVFVGGDAQDIVVGAEVDVEAELNADGIAIAEEIEFEVEPEVEIEASVESVDASAATLTVLGITVSVTDSTYFEDDSDIDTRVFGLSDINIGDFVEIGASQTGAQSATALLIKRDDDDSDDEASLEARIEALNEPELTVLGVTVRTDMDTEFETEERDSIDSSTFFQQAVVGQLVEIEGTWDGSVLTAETVELDDD